MTTVVSGRLFGLSCQQPVVNFQWSNRRGLPPCLGPVILSEATHRCSFEIPRYVRNDSVPMVVFTITAGILRPPKKRKPQNDKGGVRSFIYFCRWL
jgi:hypothetical protein